MNIYKHLHDLLLRIIFQMLNYDRCYQSPLKSNRQRTSVNWVNKDTQTQELGY